jgi:hypothetical protein
LPQPPVTTPLSTFPPTAFLAFAIINSDSVPGMTINGDNEASKKRKREGVRKETKSRQRAKIF